MRNYLEVFVFYNQPFSFCKNKITCLDGRNTALHNRQLLGMWAVFQAAITSLVCCRRVFYDIHMCVQNRGSCDIRQDDMSKHSQKHYRSVAHSILINFRPLCSHKHFTVTIFFLSFFFWAPEFYPFSLVAPCGVMTHNLRSTLADWLKTESISSS